MGGGAASRGDGGAHGAQGGRGIGGREEAGMGMRTEGDAACKSVRGRQDGGLRVRGVTPRTADRPKESGAVGVDARVLRVGLVVQRAGAEREGGAGRAGAVREALETKAVAEAAIGLRLVLGPIARVAAL